MKIRPLEWREYHPRCWLASTVNGTFTVRTGDGEDDEDENQWYLDGAHLLDPFQTPEPAKALAESLHIERIREFLEEE